MSGKKAHQLPIHQKFSIDLLRFLISSSPGATHAHTQPIPKWKLTSAFPIALKKPRGWPASSFGGTRGSVRERNQCSRTGITISTHHSNSFILHFEQSAIIPTFAPKAKTEGGNNFLLSSMNRELIKPKIMNKCRAPLDYFEGALW